MTRSFEKRIHSLTKAMNGIAGAAIVGMMLLTCADAALRFFRMPIPGTYELVSFMGAVAVSFAVAYTSAEKGHVAVSFLVTALPPRVQAAVRTFTHILGLLLFAAISWQSFLYGNELRESGELSATIQVPFYPVVYGIGFATAVVCPVLWMEAGRNLRKVFGR